MSRVRPVIQRLGKSGVAFLAGLCLFLVFYFTDLSLAAFLDAVVMIPITFIVMFRGFRYVRQHALWSVRNRLLVVYTLMGVLPIALLFALIGLSAWALMSELGIYLASSALDRRLESLQGAVEQLEKIPTAERTVAVSHFAEAFGHSFPGITFYFRDETGLHGFPASAPPLAIAPGWGDVDGLLVWNGHFYGWAHAAHEHDEVVAMAPLSNQVVENLVPNLGAIGLLETDENARGRGGAAVGSITGAGRSDIDLQPELEGAARTRGTTPMPPPVSRFDLPVFMPSTRMHYHLETPGKTFPGVLWVESRPSAVLRTFFSATETFRGVLFDSVMAVAILFLLVELIAVWIGVRLSRRITGAVNQLYLGTRRVIHGDFHNRIPVRDRDQLGELSQSFNQMTENLERLLAVEKEKERLQTELEIAREVQAQLYPKEAPPICGLKLTVRCDPARMVSGDYYDYQDVGAGKLVFAIGDVAGKGISAALLMATLQAALRAQITNCQAIENECNGSRSIDAATLVAALNKQIYAHTSPEKYATFFFGVFDEPSRTLTYTNAGHLSPLLFRKDDVVTLDSNGTVVGAFAWAKYGESCLSMTPGDLLVCYTDGITEPENAYGEMFGEERLIELVRKYMHREDHEIVALILEAVRSWTATPELHDDMTLLIAREVETA
ncbi:MAG: PP2C family protein-serine/threonine phosphatase [Acidobacteriaceae bacterium]|nr:PP2C family protein-serine/threonine phosphatase [Acidobacteriaceae bacterium]